MIPGTQSCPQRRLKVAALREGALRWQRARSGQGTWCSQSSRTRSTSPCQSRWMSLLSIPRWRWHRRGLPSVPRRTSGSAGRRMNLLPLKCDCQAYFLVISPKSTVKAWFSEKKIVPNFCTKNPKWSPRFSEECPLNWGFPLNRCPLNRASTVFQYAKHTQD